MPSRHGPTLPRRRLLAAGLALPLAVCTGGARAQPRYTLAKERLQQAIAERFPRRYPVAGLLDVDLQAPRLTLLPARNRLRAELAVAASGPLLQRRSHAGTFDVDFALRYEPSDRTIRAHALHVNALRLEGLEPSAAEVLNLYGPQLAEQSLREVVLHQLRPQDLAVADGLGLQPGEITVTEQGLAVGFVPRPAP